ncbi:MAG: PadR family transcriptional regulator [Sphingomonadales bacterium]|nr:PadR family transcriptional regulator [Sphingomonadales bacterium]
MQNENEQVQMRKGVLELCVLRILSHGEAYTSDLSDRLKQAELLVVEGTLYPLLTRMKNVGWLVYRWAESKNGPPRKYYTLTEEGIRQLQLLDREWETFVEAVQSLNQSLPPQESKPDQAQESKPDQAQESKPDKP